MIGGWLLAAIAFIGYLLLIWRLLRDEDDEDQAPVFVPDPDATVVLAAIPTWYQLNHEARVTEQLLEHAAAMLDEPAA